MDGLVFEATGRLLTNLAVLWALGLVCFRLLHWPLYLSRRIKSDRGLVSAHEAPDLEQVDQRVALWGFVAALALLLALFVRALCQSAQAFGPETLLFWRAEPWANLSTVALESRWGSRFRPQVLAAAVYCLGWIGWRLNRGAGLTIATGAALALAVALPRTGHAMAEGAVALVSQSLHIAGAGLWIGTLAVAIVISARWSSAESRVLFSAFAPIATSGFALLAASGTLTSWLYLATPRQLVETVWGRVLLLKLVLVACVALLGALHYRRYRRESSHGSASLRLELLLAFLTLAATAWLAGSPGPMH